MTTPRQLAPTVGLSARGFTIRWVQSSSATTTRSSSQHRSSRSSSTQTWGLDNNIALVSVREIIKDFSQAIRRLDIITMTSGSLHQKQQQFDILHRGVGKVSASHLQQLIKFEENPALAQSDRSRRRVLVIRPRLVQTRVEPAAEKKGKASWLNAYAAASSDRIKN